MRDGNGCESNEQCCSSICQGGTCEATVVGSCTGDIGNEPCGNGTCTCIGTVETGLICASAPSSCFSDCAECKGGDVCREDSFKCGEGNAVCAYSCPPEGGAPLTCFTGDTRIAIAAQWGVVAAGGVSYQNVEAQHRGQTKRLLVVGAQIARPGEARLVDEGRPIIRSRYEAVVDRGAGLVLGEQIKLGRDTFTVVGLTSNLVASGGDPVIFITLRDAQKLQFDLTPAAARRESVRSPGTAGTTDTVNAILVRLMPGVDAKRFAQDIARWKHLAALTQEDQETVLARSVIDRARRQIGLFTTLLLTVSTVIIGLIIYTMTIDKKKAIATLKLIGAPDRRIVGLIVEQALAMGIISFVAGAALINAGQGYFPRRVLLELTDATMLFGVVLVACLIASALGVRTALRIDPASALAG
jgi:putative ABC transport system permease protein